MTKTKAQLVKESKVKELLSDLSIQSVYFQDKTVCITIELGGCNGITYEHMKALSKLFKTDKISTSDFTRSGGCETCGYGETNECTIYVYEAK